MEMRVRTALKFRPIVVLMSLTFLFFSVITTSWYARQPRIGDSRMPIVDHIHAHHAGCTTIQGARRASRTNHRLGYLVILDIPEQVTSAIEDFVQLYMINQLHWKLGMIEPYVLGTRLAFSPPITEDFRSLPLLSTYINRSHLMHNLKECFHADVKLDTFQDFLISAELRPELCRYRFDQCRQITSCVAIYNQ